MVYKEVAGALIELTWNLSYLYIESDFGQQPNMRIPVKKQGHILDSLKRIKPMMNLLSQNFPELFYLPNSVEKWIKRFDKNYDIEYFKSRPANLEQKDAKDFSEDVLKWYQSISKVYQKSSVELINHPTLIQDTNQLLEILDKETGDDLSDGVGCLGNALPTPAVMMFYRVGESMVRKFYKKIMQKEPPEKHTLGIMVNELKDHPSLKNDSIVGLLDFRKTGRNTAQHPGKRYSQKEGEKTFFKISELIEEIHQRI